MVETRAAAEDWDASIVEHEEILRAIENKITSEASRYSIRTASRRRGRRKRRLNPTMPKICKFVSILVLIGCSSCGGRDSPVLPDIDISGSETYRSRERL